MRYSLLLTQLSKVKMKWIQKLETKTYHKVGYNMPLQEMIQLRKLGHNFNEFITKQCTKNKKGQTCNNYNSEL